MAGIRIQLELDDGTFTTRILHAGESIDKFNDKVGQTAVALQRVEPAHRSFIGHMRDVIVIVAAARLAFENLRTVTTGWAADIIKVNAEFERLTYLLRGMSSATDPMKEATGEVNKLRQMALEMPYSVKAITDTFVKLRASGTDPLNGSLKAVIDTVAAFGGTESQLKRAALALQEMAGKGVVQTKELRRQLGQDIPRAVEIMARALGVSVEQLSTIVATGTLDAKTSMEAFYGELDRTFGGSAKRMMQTFNGLMSQTTTIIQNLALEAGKAGFFDETKKQLKEFNEFLSGNQAKVFAAAFGNAMSSVVQGIRGVLDWVVRFRSEIAGVAEVLAVAFGARVIIGTLLTFGTALRGLVTTVRMFRMELNAMQLAWNFNKLDMMAGKLGILGVGISTTTGLARGATIAISALGTAMSFVSTFIVPVVAVLAAAAYAFGLFEDKVNDAYEAVKKYGAADEEQMKLAEQKLTQAERELQLAYEKRELMRSMQGVDPSTSEGMVSFSKMTDQQAKIDKLEANANSVYETLQQRRIEFTKQQNDRAVRLSNEAIEDENTIHQRGYDEDRKARDKAYAEKYDALKKSHHDTSVLEANFKAEGRALALADDQWHYDNLEQHLNDQKALVGKGLTDPAKSAAIQADLIRQQNEIMKSMERLRSMPLGPQTNAKGVNLQDALDKADQMLHTLNGNIEKSKANLAGANGELAQFIYSLEEGRNKKLNIFDNAELDAKIQRLKQLKGVYEDLKAQADGKAKLDHDLESLRESTKAKLFAEQTRDMSGLEKIYAKMKAGGYGGLKPIEAMVKQYQNVNTTAREAAGGMDVALGDKMQSKGRGMLGVVQDLSRAWGQFRLNVDGTKLNDNLAASVLGGATPPGEGVTKDQNRGTFQHKSELDAKLDPNERKTADEIAADEKEYQKAKAHNALTDKIQELRSESAAAAGSLTTFNKNLKEVQKNIAEGKYGSDKDVHSAAYKTITDEANKADAADRAREKRTKLAEKAESIINAQDATLERLKKEQADLQYRLDNGTKKKPRAISADDAKIDKENDELRKAGRTDAIAKNEAIRRLTNDNAAGNAIADEQKKIDALKKSLLTGDALRQESYNEEIKRLDELLRNTSLNADQRIALERKVAEEKALLAQKQVADSPIGKEMKSWSDIGQNFQQASAGWMGTFTDNLAKMAMKGKVDFRGMADSIIQDMMRMAIRGAIGNLMGPMMGIGGTSGGGAGKAAGGGALKGGTPMGQGGIGHAHTGGVAGGHLATRMVDLSNFVGAPRFHTGGYPGLDSSEVPIIAKKGEEIGWPDKLAKKYGGKGGHIITHNNNVTVNATGGHPQDNQDLAEKVGRAVQDSANQMVAQAIRTQMKPGGLMNR
jgi:tape measure domain-containing protein